MAAASALPSNLVEQCDVVFEEDCIIRAAHDTDYNGAEEHEVAGAADAV